MKKHIKAAVAVGLALAVAVGGSPAYAAATKPDVAVSSNPQQIQATRVTLPLAHPVKLKDAVSFASKLGTAVRAFSFNNGDIEGEYSPSPDQSVDTFLAGFAERFGTQPEVTGVVIEVPLEQARMRAQARSAPLDPGAAAFDAPLATLSAKLERFATPPTATGGEMSRAAAAAGDWRPNDVEGQITNQNGRADFFMSYWWHSGSVPAQMPTGFGAEFQIDLTDSSRPSETSSRPNCAVAYKENMWAKNYDWNWALYKPDYSAASQSTVGAYADINDLSDPCNRNSMAIGMRYPQKIQAANGGYGVMIWLSAPRGYRTSSMATGVVQAVSDSFCTTGAGSGMALTDCMGVYAGSWPLSTPMTRTTLGATRNWSVPAKCWQSQGKGLGTFTQLTPC
ncbi:hypothetical protein [Rathayibacter sp. VKM Ac-2760]|uniref:hypothetical protein n=1 Tax=Rathayibacter sp. VKM Ac-2760 TaxID=2609253 RepID=UPI00131783EF|nr:hypothetical protein [Rathayibacter sp. VKM Ac-2760]QHC61131.1 hypothetical protein GSU72_20575 [Rathayibacter sp. VKM Ac-2760]